MDDFKNVEAIRTALAEALSAPSEQATKEYLQRVENILESYLGEELILVDLEKVFSSGRGGEFRTELVGVQFV